jgi:hypothetical protein
MIQKHLKPLWLEFREIASGAYPAFVFSQRPSDPLGGLPIFCFHNVEPESFEAQLRFLSENGYSTVTSDEAWGYVTGSGTIPERSILLTFDDGRRDVRTVAWPLLKRYGFRATVFLAPGLLTDDQNDFIHWNEAGILHDEGIDFQAHSRFHHRVPVGPKITNFVHPSLAKRTMEFPIPRNEDGGQAEPGAPIFESGPALGPQPMWTGGEKLSRACVDFVAHNRGATFFKKPDWRRELTMFCRSFQSRRPLRPVFETDEARRKRILDDLVRAKAEIESNLPGKTVRHLAYPWGIGSPLAAELSKEAGYASNHWLRISGKPDNRPGSDPYRLVRLKHDFIWRLPGKGRKSFAAVYGSKFKRRASGKVDYLEPEGI